MNKLNKLQVCNLISSIAPRLKEIALQIGERPELGNQEFFASQLLMEELSEAGFSLTQNVLDLPTAFIAEYASVKPGPIIAYLCEYDALPGLGHACGHHLICTMSMAAAIGLKSVIDSVGGTIRVYGTPAEETNGAKVPMAAAGLFDDVDIALMAHPYSGYEASGASLAMDAIQYEYYGKPAHAAASPHEGINALDALLMLFNATNALRQQTRSDARIHGIITDGGKAPNIIPDYACAQFYIRSADRSYTNELTSRMLACAEGAAKQTGCTLNVTPYEYSYDELRTNQVLSSIFNLNLIELGVAEQDIEHGKDNGSVDLGNVSLRCPAIHPYVKVIDEKHQLHTTEFRNSAMTDRAMELMLIGAQALAATGYDVCSNADSLAKIQQEFKQLHISQ